MEKDELLASALSATQEQISRDMISLRQYLSTRLSQQDEMLNELLSEGFQRGESPEGEAPVLSNEDYTKLQENGDHWDLDSVAPNGFALHPAAPGQIDIILEEESHREKARIKSVVEPGIRLSKLEVEADGIGLLQCLKSTRKSIQNVVRSRFFEGGGLVLILSNVICIAVELELEIENRFAADENLHNVFYCVHAFYAFAFLFEIIFKCIANGVGPLFCGVDWLWNLLDLLMVLCGLLELALTLSMALDQLRVFRILRAARICRGMRVARLVRYVGPLRALMLSIASALQSLMWTMLLVMLILFGTGYILSQTVYDHCSDEEAADIDGVCSSESLKRFWASLQKSMYTLFMVLVGGVNWEAPIAPLSEVNFGLAVIFVLYIAFMNFAVLNVVTGIFCQNAIESANADKEIAIMMKHKQTDGYKDNMRKIFQQIDVDGSGDITMGEMEAKLEEPDMIAFFDAIELDVNDAWAMFSLIDGDRSGVIDIEEFISGCLLFRGNAKAIHVAKIKEEQKIARGILSEIQTQVREVQQSLQALSRGIPRRNPKPQSQKLKEAPKEAPGWTGSMPVNITGFRL